MNCNESTLPAMSATADVNRLLKVGMVGVSGFGAYRRARLRDAGCFEMIACCDRNADALAQACEEEKARPVADFEDLIADPDIEGIVISTGIDTHARFAIAAMNAGKHVFIEKPLCGTPEEITQLRQTRDATGRIVGVGHNDNLTDPICTLIQNFIETGKLGTVVCYEENSSHSGGLEIKPGDWRGVRQRNPGGMLMQCGVHALHRLIHLFGPVAGLAAMMRYDAHPDTETADTANVLLRHHSDLVGSLNCYHVTAYCHDLRIFGTKGNLYIDTHTKHAEFQVRKRGEVETREAVPMPDAPPMAACSNLINWHRAIVSGTAPRPSLEDGIVAIEPVFAAERAAAEKCEITLSEE